MSASEQNIPKYTTRDHITALDRSRIFTLLTSSGFFHPREMAYGMDLLDEHLLKGENSSYKFILYEYENELLAYACYGSIRLSNNRYHLHWLAVDPQYQKHGFGRLIDKAVAEKVIKLGGVKLYAEASNRGHHAPIRKFYEKCGYSLAASVTDYYADGDDKVLYVKDL